MSDTPQTVEETKAAQGAGEKPAPGAAAASEQCGHATESPDAKQAPGADGARATADEAGVPDADESALAGDVDELVAVAAQRDEYLALAQRTQADFENYRKRLVKETAAAQERGVMKLAEELLPALDNLDRALEEAAGAQSNGRDASLLEGVRLVRSELHAALARLGIESFSPKGEPFDPAQHEAVAHQPVPEVASGTVAEVFQPGYRIGNCIIRAARVLVAA